eukprot:TRINITY_DN13074_c0_g1_i1.p1 TRINITY_DN13074_c0_g1~~TRINITY_DN13074_c0_g1_i1.p1  ORF type:complete len:403 (-),score=80.10 TRINITY_DN13074_c0_g1_i1:48-1256(-)
MMALCFSRSPLLSLPWLVTGVHVNIVNVHRDNVDWSTDQMQRSFGVQPVAMEKAPNIVLTPPSTFLPEDRTSSFFIPDQVQETIAPKFELLDSKLPPGEPLLPPQPLPSDVQGQSGAPPLPLPSRGTTASVTPYPWTNIFDLSSLAEVQQGKSEPAVFPDDLLVPSNITWSVANSQAEIAKSQHDVLERNAATLEGEMLAATDAADDARRREDELWAKSRLLTNARRDEEIRQAAASARWNAEIGDMEEGLDSLLKSAKRENDDRLAAEAVVKQLQADKLLQSLVAAEALGEAGKADAYAAGSTAQRNADAPQLMAMGQALKDITAAATEGFAAQGKMNKLALEAGRKIGKISRTYGLNSPTAKVLQSTMAEAVLAGEALKVQEQAAAKSGVVIRALPDVVN